MYTLIQRSKRFFMPEELKKQMDKLFQKLLRRYRGLDKVTATIDTEKPHGFKVSLHAQFRGKLLFVEGTQRTVQGAFLNAMKRLERVVRAQKEMIAA